MDRIALIQKIGILATAVGGMAPAFTTPDSVLNGHDTDFLYEVLCYFFLLTSLRPGTSLTYIKGAKGHALPGRHGGKWEHSHFEITLSSGETLHMCMATYISDKYGRKRAPDISLQRASDKKLPSYEDALAIWDAKHRKKSADDGVARGEFEKFRGDMEVLKILPPIAGDVVERICPHEFNVSALISNGLPPQEPLARFLDHGFSCIQKFIGAPGSMPHPARAEHYAHAKKNSTSAPSPANDAGSTVAAPVVSSAATHQLSAT